MSKKQKPKVLTDFSQLGEEIKLTKSEGLPFNEWVLSLLEQAKSTGRYINTENNYYSIKAFYDLDYSAEDAWQEIFENECEFNNEDEQ